MPKHTIVNNIEKIVVNAGIGKMTSQANFEDKILPELIKDFSLITGQYPSRRSVRVSIAGFKVREGAIVGLVATLRGKRMQNFLKKINGAVFPRIRDFRGLSLSGVDQAGNLNIGIRDHFVFPEVNPEHSKVNFGIQITIVPKIRMERVKAIEFYKELGMPLQKAEVHGKKPLRVKK